MGEDDRRPAPASAARSPGPADDEPGMRQSTWANHMAALRAEYDALTRADPNRRDPRIEAMLGETGKPSPWEGQWSVANSVEIMLLPLRPNDEIDALAVSQLAVATRIGVEDLAPLKEALATATGERKRALVGRLLLLTHDRYNARRAERMVRRAAGRRLISFGFGIAGLFLVAAVVFAVVGQGKHSVWHVQMVAQYTLIICAYFGVFGAFLSRAFAFHGSASRLNFEELEYGYGLGYIGLRLLIGGMAAVMLYFLLAGNLLGGELFPTPVQDGGFGALWLLKSDTPAGAAEPLAFGVPSLNLAKLIFWSFVAGFSERFLPDHLSVLETKAKG